MRICIASVPFQKRFKFLAQAAMKHFMNLAYLSNTAPCTFIRWVYAPMDCTYRKCAQGLDQRIACWLSPEKNWIQVSPLNWNVKPPQTSTWNASPIKVGKRYEIIVSGTDLALVQRYFEVSALEVCADFANQPFPPRYHECKIQWQGHD